MRYIPFKVLPGLTLWHFFLIFPKTFLTPTYFLPVWSQIAELKECSTSDYEILALRFTAFQPNLSGVN